MLNHWIMEHSRLYLLLPEIASVGLTEAQAKEKGYDIKVGKFPFLPLEKLRLVELQTVLLK